MRAVRRTVRRGLERIGWRVPRELARRPEAKQFRVGRHTYVDGELNIIGVVQPEATFSIGSFCSVAEQVTVFIGGEHRMDWVTSFPLTYLSDAMRSVAGHVATKGGVTIGNDVWLGRGATILGGVTIGDGAVVGAGAMVTKDVAPYAIVAGNPAKLIRHRFEPETVQRLQATRWWDWPDETIREAAPLMASTDFEPFFAFAERVRKVG